MRAFGLVTIAIWILVPPVTPLLADAGPEREPIELSIDCDAGDRLDDVFGPIENPRRAVELVPDVPVLINIRGTCVGNFVIDRNNVILRGVNPQNTVLRGAVDASGEPIGSVVKALSADGLVIRDLRIERGILGLESIHSNVLVERVLIRENLFGVYGQSSYTLIRDSDIADNSIGVSSQGGDRVDLFRTDIIRSTTTAATAFDNGFVGISESMITGKSNLSAVLGSDLFLSDVRMTPTNSFGFITLGSHSHLLVSGSLDAPEVLLGAFSKSSVSILGETVLGDLSLVSSDSFLQIFGDLTGDVSVFGFSAVAVPGSLDGRLKCFPTTDATCSGSVRQSDCGNCQATRISDPMASTAKVEAMMREALRVLEQGGPKGLLEQDTVVPRGHTRESPARVGHNPSVFGQR